MFCLVYTFIELLHAWNFFKAASNLIVMKLDIFDADLLCFEYSVRYLKVHMQWNLGYSSATSLFHKPLIQPRCIFENFFNKVLNVFFVVATDLKMKRQPRRN